MTDDPEIEVWITKYALTTGITRHMGKHCIAISDGMVQYSSHGFAHGEGKQWHRTAAGAIARADAMRKSKVASMQKRIKQLEAMEFKAP